MAAYKSKQQQEAPSQQSALNGLKVMPYMELWQYIGPWQYIGRDIYGQKNVMYFYFVVRPLSASRWRHPSQNESGCWRQHQRTRALDGQRTHALDGSSSVAGSRKWRQTCPHCHQRGWQGGHSHHLRSALPFREPSLDRHFIQSHSCHSINPRVKATAFNTSSSTRL